MSKFMDAHLITPPASPCQMTQDLKYDPLHRRDSAIHLGHFLPEAPLVTKVDPILFTPEPSQSFPQWYFTEFFEPLLSMIEDKKNIPQSMGNYLAASRQLPSWSATQATSLYQSPISMMKHSIPSHSSFLDLAAVQDFHNFTQGIICTPDLANELTPIVVSSNDRMCVSSPENSSTPSIPTDYFPEFVSTSDILVDDWVSEIESDFAMASPIQKKKPSPTNPETSTVTLPKHMSGQIPYMKELDEFALSSNIDTTAKKPSPCSKIPRPPNAFIIYRRIMHSLYFKKSKLHNSQFSKWVGHQWRILSSDLRKTYDNAALEARTSHMEMYPDYKYSPQRKKRSVDHFGDVCECSVAKKLCFVKE